MIRLPTAIALATAAVASMTPALAQNRVEVGVLDCRGATTSFLVGSVTELGCMFRPPNFSAGALSRGHPPRRRRHRHRPAGCVQWAVFAPSRQIGRGELAGNYVGAAASATVGVGVGANALVGGSNNTIALQPLSVQGQTGLSVAAGIAGLELRPGP